MAVADSHNGTSHWHADLLDWVYGGVDHSLPGNGGDDCVNFLNLQQRLMESAFASCFALSTMIWGYFKVKVPPAQSTYTTEPLGKRLLLVLLCLTFGTELGFKFATRQMIWILNPCHLVTMVQIFLLAAPPCRLTMVVFRLHMHMLAGASIALIFPVINTRLLPFETCVYWIQHVLIVTIPYYLMRLGGAYTPERLTDFSWPGISLGILFLYHFLPLQWLAVVSRVNLNNMLCPAISDPFYGQFYRVCAMTHQIILIPTHGKLYTFMASLLLPKHCHPTQDISSKGNHSGHETQKNFDKGRHSYISPNEQLHVSSLSNGMIKHLTKESYTCDCNGHTKLD